MSRRAAGWRAWLAACWVIASLAAPMGTAHAQDENPPSDQESPGTISDEVEGARRSVNTASTLAGPVDPAHYRLGPGDVLSLEYGGRAFGSRVLVVDGEGRVLVPNLGVIAVAGRTLADARTLILQRLRPLLPGATLDLRLLHPRTFKVYVLGEVSHPGVQLAVGSSRVSEAIAAAGELTKEASTRNIRVLRADGREETADLERFRRTGEWQSNPYLEDGDRIVVPPIMSRFSTFGAVASPGSYELVPGDSLITAIRLAGGLLPEARRDSGLVVRFRSATALDTILVQLPDADSPGDGGLRLEADDRIFVRVKPEWHPKRNVTITGEVRSPGPFAVQEGKDRISDLIRWSGGFTEQADRRGVRLERHVPEIERDVEFERLSRLSRAEMTNSEYQTFRSKLAGRQSVYLVDFSTGSPIPPETDVLLRDGDRIDVYRLELSVRVDGSVRHPGLIAFRPGRSVSEYLRLAGGATGRGNSGDARVTRSGGNTVFARDVRQIEPGDFIWVPEKKDTSFWSVFKDVLVVAGQVATIVIVIDQFSRR